MTKIKIQKLHSYEGVSHLETLNPINQWKIKNKDRSNPSGLELQSLTPSSRLEKCYLEVVIT